MADKRPRLFRRTAILHTASMATGPERRDWIW
ncbi:hypothetical protein TIFTF001_042285 [Ficus carica]|uniref:Uncharacterized protein n=1 Tax=Ficus carica TaxID=3494 RepID=A0AA87ZNZ5_FICCA|nr:hypothetical protein TIFTF001_042285 [Ficus carica]